RRNRTAHAGIFSPSLYLLSYLGTINGKEDVRSMSSGKQIGNYSISNSLGKGFLKETKKACI
ncbi:MAG: hypothetical protein JXD21_05885, partial [Candidatus Omnitrophica bacterium]|nr:hypothetical protein [Candidatus Omnitrophota bacterium]